MRHHIRLRTFQQVLDKILPRRGCRPTLLLIDPAHVSALELTVVTLPKNADEAHSSTWGEVFGWLPVAHVYVLYVFERM